MKNSYMLTLVGADALGIVASVTSDLSKANCNLGETSMLRLGGSFSILMIVDTDLSRAALEEALCETLEAYQLKLHIDRLDKTSHRQLTPDVRVGIYGGDSPGIVAKTTRILAKAGLNITNLSSDLVGEQGDKAIYVLSISGQATQGYAALEAAVEKLKMDKLEVSLEPIQLLVG